MGGCNVRIILPINVPKCHGGKTYVFRQKVSKLSEFYNLEPAFHPSITDIVEAMNTLLQKRHTHSEICIRVKMSRRTQKVDIYLASERYGLAVFSTDPGHIFGSNVGNEFGVMLRWKGPNKPEFAYDIVRKLSLMIYTDLIEYNIVGDTKPPLLGCFPFYFEAQGWRHYNYLTLHELSDL